MKRNSNSGFTMIEIVIVIAIALVMMGIAIPAFNNAMNAYRLSATVSAATGAIQTTRYLAIMKGYPYQLVFTSSTLSYQVYNEVPPATSFSAVGTAIPLPSAGGVSMVGTSFTFTFNANGIVTSSPNPAGAAFQIKNKIKSNYIYVSGVGDVRTCQPTGSCVCSPTTVCQ